MSTKELVHWAFNAERVREESWLGDKEARYAFTMSEAAIQTRPINANDTELSIVTCWLYHCWNEVQDWQCELTK